MSKYGIEKVRSYVTENQKKSKQFIQKEIWPAENKSIQLGSDTNFVKKLLCR